MSCCLCVSSSCCQRSFRQVFQPQGLDLISAIQWWRKRVPITPPGTASAAARHVAFAVFEGSFTAEAGLCHDDLPVDLPQWFWGLHNVCHDPIAGYRKLRIYQPFCRRYLPLIRPSSCWLLVQKVLLGGVFVTVVLWLPGEIWSMTDDHHKAVTFDSRDDCNDLIQYMITFDMTCGTASGPCPLCRHTWTGYPNPSKRTSAFDVHGIFKLIDVHYLYGSCATGGGFLQCGVRFRSIACMTRYDMTLYCYILLVFIDFDIGWGMTWHDMTYEWYDTMIGDVLWCNVRRRRIDEDSRWWMVEMQMIWEYSLWHVDVIPVTLLLTASTGRRWIPGRKKQCDRIWWTIQASHCSNEFQNLAHSMLLVTIICMNKMSIATRHVQTFRCKSHLISVA